MVSSPFIAFSPSPQPPFRSSFPFAIPPIPEHISRHFSRYCAQRVRLTGEPFFFPQLPNHGHRLFFSLDRMHHGSPLLTRSRFSAPPSL